MVAGALQGTGVRRSVWRCRRGSPVGSRRRRRVSHGRSSTGAPVAPHPAGSPSVARTGGEPAGRWGWVRRPYRRDVGSPYRRPAARRVTPDGLARGRWGARCGVRSVAWSTACGRRPSGRRRAVDDGRRRRAVDGRPVGRGAGGPGGGGCAPAHLRRWGSARPRARWRSVRDPGGERPARCARRRAGVRGRAWSSAGVGHG